MHIHKLASLFPKWHVEKTDRESTLNHEQDGETSDVHAPSRTCRAINNNVSDACTILLYSAAWCS